jgi:S-adenosylhomocysteine hydrolase
VASAAGGSGGSGGSGGAGGTTTFVDAYGSLGPGQAYTALDDAADAYIADINDCIDVKNATAGNEVQHLSTVVLHCTVTIRARTQLDLIDPGQTSTLRNRWTMAGQADVFRQNPFTTAHDMRASVTLPPMLIQ